MALAPTPQPGLSGRTALVTGASSGVGLEIAHSLAATGAHVLMPVRNRGRGDRARREVLARTPGARVTLLDLDLADLSTVAALTSLLTEDLTEQGRRVDLLVLNAGVVMLGDPTRHVTVDGHELHHQTNFLGHAVLTLGLLPLLRGGRVVTQLSLAARTGRLAAEDRPGPRDPRRYSALQAYASSKVALGTFTVELARRSAAEDLGVTVHLCHPGVAPDTGIAAPVRDGRKDTGPTAALARRLGSTPREAAAPAMMAATTRAAPPAFFVPRRPGQLSGRPRSARLYRSVSSPEHGARVWGWAESALAVRR